MSTQRQPKGQPTGGQFAAQPHTDDDVYLDAPESIASHEALRTTMWRVESSVQTAAVAAMTDIGRKLGAETLHFVWLDGDYEGPAALRFAEARDADGNDIDASGYSDTLDRLGDDFDDWNDVSAIFIVDDADPLSEEDGIGASPVTPVLRIAPASEGTTASITSQLADLDEIGRGIDAHRFTLAKNAAAQVARTWFEDAHTLNVVDEGDGIGPAHLEPAQVLRADGTVIWDRDDDESEESFGDELRAFTPYLCRGGWLDTVSERMGIYSVEL